MSFREQHRDFQELVRELKLLRTHNLQFKQGDRQDRLLLFSEAALVLLTLERFLRVILDTESTERDTLPNLLQKATGERLRLLTLPADDRERAIREVTTVRNTLMHGNFEQAAHGARCATVGDYCNTQFAPEIERLYQLTEALVRQIDPETGRPCRQCA